MNNTDLVSAFADGMITLIEFGSAGFALWVLYRVVKMFTSNPPPR